ncbi:MAG: branched-chain amino acid ABC transporter permease [Deltaproteobacteria bacterium]|nr:branched-chain amino acid ABC transporter permease [Deltaproteobacteria bacterium]MBI3075589.1 branched-chain amino acid ABC transporter permease [Deltaproteobacteria bacterium]
MTLLALCARPTPIALLLAFAVMALIPLARNPELNGYFLTLLDLMLLTYSLNMVVGFSGYLSFGHIVFWGLGGYTAGMLVTTIGRAIAGELTFSPYLLVPLGGLVASAFAAVIAYPILRIRGAYFAIATFSVNLAVQTIFFNVPVFGGAEGLPLKRFMSYQIVPAFYWLLAFGLLAFLSSYLILRIKLGYGLLAILNDEDVAQTMGVNTTLYKILIYIIAAFFAGAGGAVWALAQVFVDPENFGITRSIEMFVAMLLGGVGTTLGPFIGAFIYFAIKDLLIIRFPHLHLVFFGGIIMIIVLFVPGGLVGALRQHVPGLRRILE